MKTTINAKTLAEFNELGLRLVSATSPKYVVSFKDASIDTASFIHWRNVVSYLSDDDQVQTIGYHDYLKHLEGTFKEADLAEWIEMYLTEFAAQAGYTIGEVK